MSESASTSPARVARVAIVTGASRGIGKAIALRLADPARANRHVVLMSRSEGPLNDVKHAIEATGGKATVIAVDVADPKAMAAAIDAAAEKCGRLDILVNNAGITKDGLALRMSDEDWDAVIDTNLKSAFVAIRAAARHMMRAKFGRIVNISSTSGVVGNAGQANYAAAKSGLLGLGKSIARELGGKGITCNAIGPGFFPTALTAPVFADEAMAAYHAERTCMGRNGTLEDLYGTTVFLASEASAYVTGQTLMVDGGYTAR